MFWRELHLKLILTSYDQNVKLRFKTSTIDLGSNNFCPLESTVLIQLIIEMISRALQSDVLFSLFFFQEKRKFYQIHTLTSNYLVLKFAVRTSK